MTDEPGKTGQLVPREHTFAEADLAEACGLPAVDHGLLCCELEPGGAHVTLATANIAYWSMLLELSSASAEGLAGLVIPTGVFPVARGGWPNEWEPAPGQDKLWVRRE